MSPDEGMPGADDGRDLEGLADPRAPWEELIEDPSAPRRLLAVMFTDIVGSTEIASALGDKRWREVLEQHDAAIRTQIARYGGTEIDTAGDAFFVTFELPIRAVDCALESARAVRRLGLRIRSGIHMGECMVSEGKARGVTVHIGARVGAKAKGDQVLVSNTVRDVLAGAGLKFADCGEQTLKGVEGRWRLHAVEPRERDDEADLPPLLEGNLPPPGPMWRRRRVQVAAGTALAVLIGAIAFVATRGGGLSFVPADSVAAIDASSGDVGSAVAVNRRPVGLAAAPGGGVWVANSVDRSVTLVDTARSGSETRTIPVGPGPIAVAATRDFVFVANADAGTVSRVSVATKAEVGDRIQAGNGLSAIAYRDGALWIANATDGTVWKVDPGSGRKTREIPVAPALGGLAVTRNAVWVTSESAGTLTQLDPNSGVVVRVIPVGHGPVGVAATDRAVWVANGSDRTAVRVDVTSGRVTATRAVGRGARSVAVDGEHVFVANEEDGTVSMLDASDGRLLRTIGLRNAPMGLVAAGKTVWVSVRGGIGSYRGGTLRLAVAAAPAGLPTLDPGGVFGSIASLSIQAAAYDGLTAFKKVGGPEGNVLVPDLAEEIRPPTDDGTTYTFTLRDGLTYSDGTPVRASDVRTSYERIFLNQDAYGQVFLSILRGADRCSPKKCDLSGGIVTDDRARTVVFHLRSAYADFPYNLALPNLSIVPGSTPKVVPGSQPIPGTGPYRIASVDLDPAKPHGKIVLERNPHFRPRELAQPDGYADRIEITLGFEPEALVDSVGKDRYDLTLDLNQLPGIPFKQLSTELPAQVHVIDMPSNLFVTLNEKVPPFNNEKARRAINYALDRRAMIAVRDDLLHGDVSCQLLPRNTIGFVPYCPYTKDPNPSGVWKGPDLETARRLVRESGTAGQPVTVWIMSGDSLGAKQRQARGPIVTDALRKIGYRVTLASLPEDRYFASFTDPNDRRQVGLFGWGADYAGAANFVLPLLTCHQTLAEVGGGIIEDNISHFCSPAIDALTRRALQVQLNDPVRARDQWALVDRAFTDTAALVPWATLRNVFLTSRRVGNLQGHATYIVLITQMWVVEAPKPTPS